MSNVKIISSAKSWIESNAVAQLEKTVQLQGVVQAVGLPDLHFGKGVPVGSAILVKDRVYPHLTGNDIGCGMAFFKTDVLINRFKADKAQKKLKSINGLISVDLEDDFLNQFPDNDFKEKFGTIGSGNHFAEFQSVDKIICEENFSKNGLDKKFLYLLVHSGSRGYGNRIFDDCFNVPEFSKGFVYGSPSFDNYISGHNRALLWAELNRKAVAVKLLSLLNMNCDAERVLDLSHNYIEEKGSDDKKFFLHRKGAVSGEKGLIVIPGSRGSYSYLAEPVNSAAGSLYSVSHGAGRKWERSSCRRKLENKYTRDSIGSNKFGSRVICNDVNVLFEEAPEAYKNIDQVIADLVSAELIKVIAVLKPVLTYKDV